jgi:hypothetical protein
MQARLDALDEMISSGLLQSRHGDTMLTFRSTTDLLKARQFVQDQIDDLNGTSRPRVRYAYQTGKGL